MTAPIGPEVTLGDAARVVRGGFWEFTANFARNSARYSYGANFLQIGSGAGFRQARNWVP